MPKRTEEIIQEAVIKWAELSKSKYPELEFLHHSPNGGKRNVITAVKMKRAGTKAGFPDLILPVKRGKFSGLLIEMKAPKGKASESQSKWIKFLNSQDYFVTICKSADDAISVLRSYLTLDKL